MNDKCIQGKTSAHGNKIKMQISLYTAKYVSVSSISVENAINKNILYTKM